MQEMGEFITLRQEFQSETGSHPFADQQYIEWLEKVVERQRLVKNSSGIAESDYEPNTKQKPNKFNVICEQELFLFNNIISLYEQLKSEDGESAYNISVEALSLADRFAELSGDAIKIAHDYGWQKTEFCDWSYRKYSVLKEIHTHCRMIWKNCEEIHKFSGR